MSERTFSLQQLLEEDQRYPLPAYQFIREGLVYAHEVLRMGQAAHPSDRHITGQELCEALRLYALEQFGFMAKTVLNNWGIFSTNDFGEIVYNLIRIGHMRKSESDRREDFHNVYDFETAFEPQFAVMEREH
ncbi:MAG: hypothetical protein KatS3mg111_4109 [Pirellulaceae bacterium]|nr:MAG: hypothetical protein KatS3mg111_4109 [Pirellulaceae bacterium]